MSFVVNSIDLYNFRSYEKARIKFSDKVTVLFGPNGAGKTNIIEALQLLTIGESFKNSPRSQQIFFGANESKLSLKARDGLRERNVEISISNERRIFSINGKSSNSTKVVRGEIPSILFTPDDLLIIKDSAERRRNEIDLFGSVLSRRYESLTSKYKRVLTQRNKLLKSEVKDELLLDILTDQLSHLAASLIKQRIEILKRLTPYLKDFYSIIDPLSSFDIAYVTKNKGNQIAIFEEDFKTIQEKQLIDIYKEYVGEFKRQKEKEFFQKVTLVGPHRDDIGFYLNKKNVRDFGSQGQQRSVVLSLKIAEALLIEEVLKKKPVLLLDDVFSELDETRREALFEIILKFGQTVITTAHLNYLSDEILSQAMVIEVEKLS